MNIIHIVLFFVALPWYWAGNVCVCVRMCVYRWNSISDKPVLLRNSILLKSLTALCLHALLIATNLGSIYFFQFNCPSQFSLPLQLVCHFLCMLQCFYIDLSLIYSMCQIQCHGWRHGDINSVRTVHSTRICAYLSVIVVGWKHAAGIPVNAVFCLKYYWADCLH